MTSNLLEDLLKTLDAPQARYTELERYASGRQKLAYLSPDARIAEVVPVFVEFEVAVPHLRPAGW